MKKHWLRGVLLGASLALLLAGGVALAAGLQVTADKYCFECGLVEDDEATISYTPSPYRVELRLVGHDPQSNEPVRTTFYVNGNQVDYTDQSPPANEPAYAYLTALCGEEPAHVGFADFGPRMDGQVIVAKVLPVFEYGQWVVEVEQKGVGSDQITLTLARDCPEEEEEVEFVPEPGTIGLLGSGLAGLAGYATLRWRTRK